MPQITKHTEMSIFLTAFTQAAIDVFSAFSKSRVTATGVRKIEQPLPSADIYGTMFLTGDTTGKIEVALYKKLARQVAANIGHCDPEQLNDDEINDGVGELVNQIAGNTRTKLWEQGYKTEISPPKVTEHSNIAESDKKNNQSIYVIDFNCTCGFAALQICLRLTNSKPVATTQS